MSQSCDSVIRKTRTSKKVRKSVIRAEKNLRQEDQNVIKLPIVIEELHCRKYPSYNTAHHRTEVSLNYSYVMRPWHFETHHHGMMYTWEITKLSIIKSGPGTPSGAPTPRWPYGSNWDDFFKSRLFTTRATDLWEMTPYGYLTTVPKTYFGVISMHSTG